MDNSRATTRRKRQNKRAPYSFEGNTIDTLDAMLQGAQTFTMTHEEARAFVNAKRHKRKIKSAVNARIENYVEDYEDYGTVEDHRDANPLDILPDTLTPDIIINVGKTLSQRNTDKRQQHADAWNKIFAAAVDAYMEWEEPPRATLKSHNSRSCLWLDVNRAQYIQLRPDNRVIQLIKLGYMTNAPVRPTAAFSFELLKLFHMLKNTGGLSADAFAKVLRQSLEQSYLQQLPDFDKRFRDTYYRWLRMHQECRKRQDNAIEVTVQPTDSIRFNALATLCPSCFGSTDAETREDRPTISIDGNFQQVHGKDVSPISEPEPEYFFMDPTKTETRKVKANSCASNFQAPKQRPGDALFDSQGLLGVVCRHGHPLFCRNLFTKGEPFGDVLEIVKQVVQRYPTAPKWGVTYDVGCALENSLTMLGKELDKDFLVAVNKFHVYAHQFSCQVKYHPHRRPGLGDTDGEGIERYWSKAAFLVRQLKTSSAIHRHQSLDAHIEYTSSNMTRELGAALCDRLWRATKALKAATWDLEKLNVNEDDILAQIDSQKTYVTTRSRERLPSSVQQVRVVADNIEKLMIERNYELEQVHTRLRGHKNTQAVFSKIRRRRPAVEKEIRRYNALVDALPIAPELKPEKISYELLQKEMNGKEETSSLLHHFFKLDNFGMILSNVPRWVNSQGMRQAIQLHLQIQALHQEIAIIRAEVMRAIQWAMENLKALIAYARGNKSGRRFETIFVDKMWAGVQVAKSFLDNLDSMSNADFSMEEAKMQKPYLQELIERAYSCLPSESQGQNFDGELVVESDTVVSDQNFVDEEDEDCIPTDAIFDLAMLSVDDNQVDDQEAN